MAADVIAEISGTLCPAERLRCASKRLPWHAGRGGIGVPENPNLRDELELKSDVIDEGQQVKSPGHPVTDAIVANSMKMGTLLLTH